MGYTGLYSLGARCGSEAIATGLMIFLGEGTLANELLNKTKGHNMGFGWVRLMLHASPSEGCNLNDMYTALHVSANKGSSSAKELMLWGLQVAFGFGYAFFVALICLSVRPNPTTSLMSHS